MAFDGWFFGLGGSHSDLFDFGSSLRGDDHFSPSALLGDVSGYDLASQGFEWRVEIDTWSGYGLPAAGGKTFDFDAVSSQPFLIEDTPFVIGASEDWSAVFAAAAADDIAAAVATVEAAPNAQDILAPGGRGEHYTDSSLDDIVAWRNGWADQVAEIGDGKGEA